MSTPTTPSPIDRAEAAGLVLFSVATALPKDGSAPEWVTAFPRVGRVETRDGRAFDVSASDLMAAFKADDIMLPVDVNHATDIAAFSGGRADAVGWITELREHGGGLQMKVDWLEEGKALLAARKYLYTSPSFYQDKNRAIRLKALALVTSPALARQPALASAGPLQEPSMKAIATALGLSEGATEAECLTALSTAKAAPLSAIRKALGLGEAADETACLSAIGAMVPKALHDQTVTNLTSATTRIDALEKAGREKEVKDLFEGALKERRILPAQVATLTALCATDEGLSQVKAHIAASPPMLQGSGLEGGAPGGGDALDPVKLAAEAQKIVSEHAAAGQAIGWSEAVALAAAKKA